MKLENINSNGVLYKNKIQNNYKNILNEEIKHIKKQMTNFINENISLKTTNDALVQENDYKEKEIEKYKIL